MSKKVARKSKTRKLVNIDNISDTKNDNSPVKIKKSITTADYMFILSCANYLASYNSYRKGSDTVQLPNPKLISHALDVAIYSIKELIEPNDV